MGQFSCSSRTWFNCADIDFLVNLTNIGNYQEDEEEGMQNERCICRLEERECRHVCINKKYAVESQRSYTDELNIFNPLFWFWGVCWVLTQPHVLARSGRNTGAFWGNRTLQHWYENTQVDIVDRLGNASIQIKWIGEVIMLQRNLIEFINTLMIFATRINLWRLVGRHECEAV